MIERFNFYDIYGYLLPGALLLGLAWLPAAIVAGVRPPTGVELALIGAVASYLLGHLLHIIDRYLFAVTKKDVRGKARFPHDLLLDKADGTFSPELRAQIADQIQRRFGLNVTEGDDVAGGELGKRRGDAFQLCRRWLSQEKVGSYAEQFEGLYSLMRGLASACLAAMSFYFGWAIASFPPPLGSECWDMVVVFGVMIVAGGLSMRFPKRLFLFFGLILGGAGFIAGRQLGIQGYQGYLLAGGGLVLAWAGWQFHGAFRSFTYTFAATVYRDFFVLATTERGAKSEK
jgi:hypothetical protein